jgi:hypothetical protein
MNTKYRFAPPIRHASILLALISGFTLLSANAANAGTHEVYVTDDRTVYHHETNLLTEARLRAALAAKDSRPAEADPEGNWGAAVEGFQLSIRLDKATYTNGEPIAARVILRNVSGGDLKYRITYGLERDFVYSVKRGEEELLSREQAAATNFLGKLRMVKAGSSGIYTSPAWTQRACSNILSDSFELNARGDYTVIARREIPTQDAKALREVVSGTAHFRIE